MRAIFEVSRTFRHGRSGFCCHSDHLGKATFVSNAYLSYIRIWIAFRELQCRVCIKNVTNVPTRTFCFVAATQINEGKKLLFVTRILAITIRIWITFR